MIGDRELAEQVIASGLVGDGEDLPPAPEKYEISHCLGRGGAGAVYLATDLHLRRPVALKYLRHARPAELERFVREARFAARLRSPAIVQVYEAGEVDGIPFIAMQYVEGGNLGTAALDRAGVLRVAVQVAGALAHAHREGIVHRDIKPENILVDRDGHAFVTDFGIARDLRGELGATISAEGQIMGTPALMPPEQARGDVHAVDARSDVYALGATLYRKLTGHWPFRGTNVVDVLHAVLHDEPVFPRSHDPSIPRDVEEVLLRCMRKRRDERYASMREVERALEDCLRSGERAGVASHWFASYVRRTVPDAPAPPPESTEDRRDLHQALEVAREIAGWDAELYRVGSNLPRTFPRLDAVIARLDRVLDAQPAVGWARFYRGLARFRRGDLALALEDMERSIDRVKDHSGAYFELGRLYLALYLRDRQRALRHVVRTGMEHELAAVRGRLEQAQVAFEEARRVGELPPWQREYAGAVGLLAAGDAEGCAAACEAILGGEPDLDEVWKLLGDARRALGKDPVAAYDRAVEVRRSCWEAEVAKAEHLLDRRDLPAARAALQRALVIHPGLAAARVLLGRTYLEEGAVERARALGTEARELDATSYDAAVLVAETELRAGMPDAAEAALDDAAKLEGCQNRVGLLKGRVLLARGGRAELERLLARCREFEGRPDCEPWMRLADEARAALGRV